MTTTFFSASMVSQIASWAIRFVVITILVAGFILSATRNTSAQCTAFNVKGSGVICSSDPGLTMTLSGSQIGVSYQLKNAGTNIGPPKAGTGSALSWTRNTLPGRYGVTATKSTAPACTLNMFGMAMVIVNPLPMPFAVSGTGAMCSGGTGLTVTLSGSQNGVNYQLKRGSNLVGSPVSGNGSALTWSNIVTAGTYTVSATDSTTGCAAAMTGSAVITVNSLPTVHRVSGTGSYCEGGAGRDIALSDSQSGVNYQLLLDGVNSGPPVVGTGNALSWPGITTVGTYTVVATNPNTSCIRVMNSNAIITIVSIPIPFVVGGGGTICSGASGLAVTLSGSVQGVNYHLQNNGVNVGTTKAGTGSALSWTRNNSPGNYTVVAASAANSTCVQTMADNAVIRVNPLPTQFTVGGAGTICAGDPGLTISLDGSQGGINYQLKRNSTLVGSALAGTESTLSWAGNTSAGTYTVIATNPSTNCTATMTANAVVTVNALPTAYRVGGGGNYCAGSTGSTVTLSNSQTGVNYQLRVGGVNIGAVQAGTASPLSWPENTTAGTYTIVATNANTNCVRTMTGSVAVAINSLPTLFAMSGGSVCAPGSITVGLSGSQSGINYQLKINDNNSGSIKPGTGGALTWGLLSAPGSYTIVGASTTGCAVSMTGTATVNALPVAFSVIGGGAICNGTAPPISLGGSEAGVNYQLKLNNVNTGAVVPGTDSILIWNQSVVGTYTVSAVDAVTTCAAMMTGNSTISILPPLNQYAISGGGVICAAPGNSLTLVLSGSDVGVNYQLELDGVNISSPMAGSGVALSWNQNAVGTYTVRATRDSTTCTQTMNGTATIAVDQLCSTLAKWSFQYKYDGLKRMTHKRVPGADWVYMVYDLRDRLVMTQDGNQRVSNQWVYMKYDRLNRPVESGIYTHPTLIDQEKMSDLISTNAFYETYNGDAATHGYTNTVFASPNFNVSQFDVMNVTYYDDYSFKTLFNNPDNEYKPGDLASVTSLTGTYSQEVKESIAVTGQVTGTKTKVLGTSTYLLSVQYYDSKNRPIQSVADNFKGGKDCTTSILDFNGKVLALKTSHNATNHSDQRLIHTFEYDHTGRLIKSFVGLNGAPPVLLVQNDFNELGQLIDKRLYSVDGGTRFKQSIDSRYNIRGWLTSLNNATVSNDGVTNDDTDDLFGMELGYNSNGLGVSGAPQYNGNINSIKWSSNAGLGVVKDVAYNYKYDPMNRLLSATYVRETSINNWSNASNEFSEDGYTYDLNGNILALNRKGASGSNMDALTYNYGAGANASNKLLSVADAGDKANGFIEPGFTSGSDYLYDPNGNMISDQNKGITSIMYNHLNLPAQVNKNTSDYLRYTYDANGRKLVQQVFNAGNVLKKTSDYAGDFFYENDTLKFINHEEGRIVMTDAVPEFQFNLKDHLGNVRVTFTTKDEISTNIATVELTNASVEQAQFLNIDKARRVNGRIFDHTYNGTAPPVEGSYSTRLTGSTNEKIALAKSLSVMPGDKIDVEVFAKYVDSNAANDDALMNVLTAIARGTAGPATVVDGSGYGSAGNATYPFIGTLNHNDVGTAPKAYLNYFLFDHNFIPISGGFKRISTSARESGDSLNHTGLAFEGVAHERIAFDGADQIKIAEPGYVYIWLSNEEATPVEVYFDDFKVTHVKSPVVAMDDYYTFGLRFNSCQKESSLGQKYLYNNKEEQDELELSWFDFGRRMYMPELGRFMVQDRFTEKFFALSSYQFAADNPMSFIDMNGDSIVSILRQGQNVNIVNSALEDGGENFTNSIVLNSNVSGNDISDFSAGVINDAMLAIGDTEIGVSSGTRTPEEQAAVMYNNLENGTVAGEKETYGNSGDAVIDSYVAAKAEKPALDAAGIKQKMLDMINEKGPENVSDHTVADNTKINVFDIMPSTVSDPTKFHNALAGDSRVTTGGKVLSKVNKPSEKSIHVKIKQNQ